jgi:foldase protein PrsA
MYISGKHRFRTSARKFLLLTLSAAVVCSVSSCGSIKKIIPAVQNTSSGNEVRYSRQQMLLVVLSQKKSYQNAYTEKIWNTAAGSSGKTFRDVFFGETEEFFRELTVMNLLASKNGISLGTEEKRKIEEAADSFFESSVQKTEALQGMTKEETEDLFRQYFLAVKTEESLISGSRIEVSDSDARVVRVQQIVTADSKTANDVHQKAAAGDDFYSLAKTSSSSGDISLKIVRGTVAPAIEDAVFALNDGEISSIVLLDGKYYIFKCVQSYDREETAIRKKTLEKERLNATVRKTYEDFAAQSHVTMDASLWEKVVSGADSSYEGADFFTSVKEGMKDGGV